MKTGAFLELLLMWNIEIYFIFYFLSFYHKNYWQSDAILFLFCPNNIVLRRFGEVGIIYVGH